MEDSHLKLRLALRAAQIGIWDWNLETNEMNYSPRAREIYGFTPDETVTYEKVRDATHPEDLPITSARARSALDPAVRNRDAYEYRILRVDDGELRWLIAHGEAIFLAVEGVIKAVRFVGTLEDITERKSTELALRESERRQRLAIDAARMAVWELDIDTDRVTASPELNRMFGLPAGATPSLQDLRGLYAPGEREKVQQAGAGALAAGNTHFEAEFRCRWPNGELHWLLLRAEIIHREDGKVDRVIGVLLDIDERKRAEERQLLLLRELNHRVKNSLAVIQSIASQSFRGRAAPAALEDFRSRLSALASANDVLLSREWTSFSLARLVESIVEPYRNPAERFQLRGEDVDLPPRLNVPLALALHELCTNAAKYGSLSVDGGSVRLSWRRTPGGLELAWSEHDGPAVAAKVRKSFGMRLITEILAVEIGRSELEFHPDGLRCVLTVDLFERT